MVPPGGTADRLHCFEAQSEPFQRAADETARTQLLTQAGMRLGNAADGDHFAVGIDPFRQRLDTIESAASLRQELDPARILDRILGHDRSPELGAVTAKLARRRGNGSIWTDNS